MKPVGIVFHSTGCNAPYLKRWVDNVADFGKNLYGNHWNSPTATKSTHAMLGLDKDGKFCVAHTMPYNHKVRLVGKGSKGSYNSTHVQFELCEDNLKNEAYYREAIKLAEDYCVYLCQTLGLTANDIVGHYEAHKRGYGNNHGDPQHWMKRYGDDMDHFRARVDVRLFPYSSIEPEKPQPPAPPVVKPAQPRIKVRINTLENTRELHVAQGTVMEMPLEEYLKGVVAREIGNAPLEACMAQAIAARTYALELTKNGAAINDGPPHQAYSAIRGRDPAYFNAHEGVKRTEGLVLMYNGALLDKAWYHDSNGGQMLQSGDVWSENRPFLRRGSDFWTKASKKKKNGHGVGLSQQGAIWAATRGVGYLELLDFYYPNTEIREDWGKGKVFDQAEPAVLYRATVKTAMKLSLNLWATPSKSFKTGTIIPRDAVVDILGIKGSPWVYIRYNGAIGYVDGKYLKSDLKI